MRRIAIIAAVMALMCQGLTAIAQDYPEYDRFAEEAGEMKWEPLSKEKCMA